jgi:hypothetical protein
MIGKLYKIFAYGFLEALVLALIIVLFVYTEKSMSMVVVFIVAGLVHIACSLWSINDILTCGVISFGKETVEQAMTDYAQNALTLQ